MIRLLGPPRIELGDCAVTFDTRKAVALLAYLAERGRPVRRELLALLLWPDYAPQRAMANLRRTIWAVHQALGTGRLRATPAEIELLRGADLWVDLDRFRQLLEVCCRHGHAEDQVCPDCLSPLGEAIALVRGPFLEGFSLADSAEFDDWQALQTIGVRQLCAEALRRLAEGYAVADDLPQALDMARRWVELDPLHEPAQRCLMLLYAWAGQHVEALRCYRELERLLARELATSPERETFDLFAAIKVRQEPPPPRIAAAPTSSAFGPFSKHLISGSARLPPAGGSHDTPSRRPPANAARSLFTPIVLVAREHEAARLERQLGAALDGQARAIFVVGDAGSGKTALLEEFTRLAQVAHPDVVVARGNCNAYIGVGDPYLPFRQILELLAGGQQTGWHPADLQGDQADLLRRLMPMMARALVTVGQDLLGTLLPAHTLLARITEVAERSEPWFQQLQRIAADSKRPVDPMLQQSSLFEQYARVLRAVAQEQPLLLVLDDLQWADVGSINLLLHLGRRLEAQPVLIVGAYRSVEATLGRHGERHPLEPVVHELQRIYGEHAIDLSATQSRRFVDDLLDQQPNSARRGLPRDALPAHRRPCPLHGRAAAGYARARRPEPRRGWPARGTLGHRLGQLAGAGGRRYRGASLTACNRPTRSCCASPASRAKSSAPRWRHISLGWMSSRCCAG